MPVKLRVIRLRELPVHEESFDVQELASEAAEALEAYQRAPWRQLNDQTRMAKLRRAITLLQRVEGLETGRTPMRVSGG
jgi:hypothetical protein